MGDEHINPDLLRRLGRNVPGEDNSQRLTSQIYGPPSARYRPDQDRFKPASMQPGSDKLAIFWIAYFAFFLIVAPVLIDWL